MKKLLQLLTLDVLSDVQSNDPVEDNHGLLNQRVERICEENPIKNNSFIKHFHNKAVNSTEVTNFRLTL